MQLSPLVQSLIDALRCLPGVGAKSAQRMAFELLERKREQASKLGEALLSAMQNVQHCSKCRILTEEAECAICRNEKRLGCAQLCIVESPSDVLAIEQTGQFVGRYFVLMGHLSPIDGIGPEELGLDNLVSLLKTGDFSEVILATNPTMEGEATAHYIAAICDKLQITVTRIAHGVPVGGELGYVDGSTLAHAFSGRKSYQS